MADWTTPKTWNVGDVLTASDMDTYVRDNTPIFYWKTTSKQVVSTIAETDLLNSEITIAANVMGSNRRMRFWACGDGKNNTGGTAAPPKFKFKVGSTVGVATGSSSSTLSNSATRFVWVIYIEMQQMGATNAQEISLYGSLPDGALSADFNTGEGSYSPTSSARFFHLVGRNNIAVDMTSAQALTFTVENGANSANYDTTLKAAKVAIGT